MMRTKKKAPGATGARSELTATRATCVSYPYFTRTDPTCQQLPTYLSRELDAALADEEAYQEAGTQLLAEAQRLARLGFRHMRQAQEARQRRAALERAVPTETTL